MRIFAVNFCHKNPLILFRVDYNIKKCFFLKYFYALKRMVFVGKKNP
ncbi:hypothetical protein HMPREF1403_01147 [Helicobacter pylori GAM201Ai]|nr:hypothetical protein HMPREF1403_01147 [Helicobacter pylori GAM201Ai]